MEGPWSPLAERRLPVSVGSCWWFQWKRRPLLRHRGESGTSQTPAHTSPPGVMRAHNNITQENYNTIEIRVLIR